MPDPLSLRPGLDAADPHDLEPRRELADVLNEEHPASRDPRADVLRAACAVHGELGWLLRTPDGGAGDPGVALPDRFDAFWTPSDGWAAAAEGLDALAAAPEDSDAYRARYARLVRGDIPLDPGRLEPTLRLQYDLQSRLLSSLGLLDSEGGGPGITAVDGNRYPVPTFADVLGCVDTPALRTRLAQGFDTLLVVPLGLPLDRILDAWRAGLRRNAETLRRVSSFNDADPLWVWDGYTREPLVYRPRSFSDRHGGWTKDQILAAGLGGWDVLLVEGALADLPREGEGQPVRGRPQPECGRTPAQYSAAHRAAGEEGLTPEAYVIQFLDALSRRGVVLDTRTFTYLTGAYLPSSRAVPGACWRPEAGRASLSAGGPGYRSSGAGARAAVRVA